MSEDDLMPLLDIYSEFRTLGSNSICEDVIMVTLIANLPDQPSNPLVSTVFQKLKKMSPKHLPPKIGKVLLNQTEIARRSRGRVAFQGMDEQPIVVTTQSETVLERKPISTFQEAIPFSIHGQCLSFPFRNYHAQTRPPMT